MLRSTLVGTALWLGCNFDEALGAALHGQRLQQLQLQRLQTSGSSSSSSSSSSNSSSNSSSSSSSSSNSSIFAGGNRLQQTEVPAQALAHSLNRSLPAFAAASRAKGPVRVARGAESSVGGGKRFGIDSEAGEETGKVVSECFLTAKVHSGSNKEKVCPQECPFYVQDRQDWDFCTFACVPETHCSQYNPETPIADKDIGFCRSCTVAACEECDNSVNFDQCSKCSPGYYLKDGECWFKYGGDWVWVTAGILAGVVLLVAVWLIEWGFRPTTNQAGLDHALLQRERCKLKMKKEGTGERKEFPLTTNLLKEQVAGPGMTLHFNFQVFLMIWAVFVAIVWVCFAAFIDEDLWRLGTRKFGTPRENCILVMWGYERQQDLMWTKVAFLWIVYIGSFSMCMAYGIYQLRCFQGVDHQNKTMKDFVAMVTGLPAIPGFKDVEGELKKCLENTTGQSLVGVSVAWDWQEHQEAVETALEEDLNERVFLGGPSGVEDNDGQEMGFMRSTFYKMERGLLGLGEEGGSVRQDDGFGQGALAATGGSDELPIEQMLQELHTSPRAFAVFETQEAKERAVAAVADLSGFEFEGASGIALEELEAEPDTVQWIYYGHSTRSQKIVRLVAGFGCIILACLFWAVVFYAPYAYYVMTFNYENGREPGFIVGFAFSMIVVVGNAIMYEVCARISDKVGFQFKDDKEACYMILYTIACLFNVALDFVTTYYTAEKVMEGLGFVSYFGTPLADIHHFTTKFETYGMQRSLAENTYSYAFPSTYLIPFLIEPAPTILAPLLLGRLIVRTHPEVQGKEAEEWMAMADMEMGRYADLLLNVILGILIFYFPGGYTWMLFLAMAVSHLWIYAFDHYRVLRSVPACTFAAYDIEWWCQAMLAPIMGIIASCLAFKGNCEPGMYCLTGFPLIATCSFAWLMHTIFHTACLIYLVPMCGKRLPDEDPAAHETFTSLSQRVPCNWFTANPIWCLRSKFKFKHAPACSFYQLGKERYMKYSPKTGCFFDEQDASPIVSNMDVKFKN
mmetsp:Transcript_28064/g.60937  ORF Transcript_28064/g.60937 Transcript_28064/m.60937 type:complete len:1021 (+) Transcript_28064:210-3272(+)